MNKLILSAFLATAMLAGPRAASATVAATGPSAAWVKQAKAAVNDALGRHVVLDQPDRSTWPKGVEERYHQAEELNQDDVTLVFSLSVSNRLAYLVLNDAQSEGWLFDGFGKEIAHGDQEDDDLIHWK
jgi:hypothetical protein